MPQKFGFEVFKSQEEFEGYKTQLLREKHELAKQFESENLKEGSGKIKANFMSKSYVDGSKYKGQFVNSKRHGLGIYYYSNGDIYGGHWANDVFDGEGFYIFNNGERYQGQLKAGKKHGQGRYFYANGRIYNGNWAFDNKNGKGSFINLKNGGKKKV